MDTVLLVLAALGAVFIVLAIAVFLGAARRNVSEAEDEFEQSRANGGAKVFRLRSGVERRRGSDRRQSPSSQNYPLVDSNGIHVTADRRRGERRQLRERRRVESARAQG